MENPTIDDADCVNGFIYLADWLNDVLIVFSWKTKPSDSITITFISINLLDDFSGEDKMKALFLLAFVDGKYLSMSVMVHSIISLFNGAIEFPLFKLFNTIRLFPGSQLVRS